jgi:hypothetical protein
MGCRRDNEREISYYYWVYRLRDLHDELANPKPRGYHEWWEKISKPRHVMLATIGGIIIAIILGVGSLVVGILQVWISYQQWKYPTSTTSPS